MKKSIKEHTESFRRIASHYLSNQAKKGLHSREIEYRNDAQILG